MHMIRKIFSISIIIILPLFTEVLCQNILNEIQNYPEKNLLVINQNNNQQNKILLLSHYYWKGNKHSTDYYTYDNSNKLTGLVQDFVPTGPPDRRYEYIYNEELLVTSKGFSRQNDSSEWKYDIVHYLEYNTEKRIIFKTVCYIENSQEVNVSREIYTYENNLEKECLRQEWKNDSWNDYTKLIKIYDSNNNVIEEVHYSNESNNWIFYLRINYTYQNSKLSQAIYDWGLQDFKIIEYTYDENYLLVDTYISPSLNDYKTKFYSKEEYFYDSEEYLINNKNFLWDNEAGEFLINTEYIYEYTDITSVADYNSYQSKEIKLQNYPNPFNPITTISYYIPEATNVKINIYDCLGEKIATLIDEEKSVGNYSVEFNASHLASGIYFYQIEALNKMLTQKMLLLK